MKGISPTDPQIKIVPGISGVLPATFTEAANLVLTSRDIKGDYNGLASAMHAHRGYFDQRASTFDAGINVPLVMDFMYDDHPKRRLREFAARAKNQEIKNAIDQVLSDIKEIESNAQKLGAKSIRTQLRALTTYNVSLEELKFRETVIGRVIDRLGLLKHKDTDANWLHFDNRATDEKHQNPNFTACRVLAIYSDEGTLGARNDDIVIDRKGRPHLKFGRSLFSLERGDVCKGALAEDADITKPFAHIGPATDQLHLILAADIY